MSRVSSVGGRFQHEFDGNKDADPEGANFADVKHTLRQPSCALLHALHHCTCACAAVIPADDSGRRAPIWCISARKQTRGQTAVRGNYKILQPDLASLSQPLCCRAMQCICIRYLGMLAWHSMPFQESSQVILAGIRTCSESHHNQEAHSNLKSQLGALIHWRSS